MRTESPSNDGPSSSGHSIAADHPALAGHFPGHPIVPAVLILETVLAEARRQWPQLGISGVRKAKFLRPLAPADMFSIHFTEPRNGGLRFRCLCGDQPFAEGNLQWDPACT
jgi:3-hydroxyacyl-[acyl-carrier-protein] dehydratase